MNWQPIETAPKEGRILVFDPEYSGGLTVIARYWGGAFRIGDLPGIDCYPSHWMPLPEPPDGTPA